MIFLLLACDGGSSTPGDQWEEVPLFAPALGDWTAHISGTWEGDCALADANNYEPEEQSWILDEYRYGFAIRDSVGYFYGCGLEGFDFLCELPIIADDFSAIGYDVRATYSPSWQGTFEGESSLVGTYELHAECEGTDCDLLTGYGEEFTFPCTATAELSATAN